MIDKVTSPKSVTIVRRFVVLISREISRGHLKQVARTRKIYGVYPMITGNRVFLHTTIGLAS